MSQESQRRIIVGIDDSPSGLAALRWALSRAGSRRAHLVAVRSWALGLPRHGGRHCRHLVHPRVVLYFGGAEQRDASATLVDKAFRVANDGRPSDVDVTIRTPGGDPGAALTRIASCDGDLIVAGREHVPSWRRARRGSVSRYCCGHARCPAVVLSDGGELS